jgi:deoxyhypusine synthase
MMASGLRGVLTQLIEKKRFNCVITTGGSIDHDLIKSFDPYLLGGFGDDDAKLHEKGINRIGNILVPSDRYVLLEEKIQKVFEKIYEKKNTTNHLELVSEISKTLPQGSFLRACADNGVKVFSPGMIDSAIGLQLYFFKQEHKDFVLDETGDMNSLAQIALTATRTGALILGGGISKHHTLGINLTRGGLDYSVYLTTASAWDGSLSGAVPSEAKSWGKIREKGRVASVYGDASIILPILAAKFV